MAGKLPVKSDVEIYVFNIVGQKVATVVDGWIDPGYRIDAAWYPACGSGVYFCRMTARALDGSLPTYKAVKKLLILNFRLVVPEH